MPSRVLLAAAAWLMVASAFDEPAFAGAEDDIVRILALGASLTANYEWPQLLAQRLTKCFNQEVTVEVVAEAGANSNRALRQFASRRTRAPDVILAEFAINDADLLDGVRLRESAANHAALLARVRAHVPQAKVFLVTTNPAFGLAGWLRISLEKYYDLYRDFADSGVCGIADFYPDWLKSSREVDHDSVFPDGLHPVERAANELMLPRFQDLIAEALFPDGGARCIGSGH